MEQAYKQALLNRIAHILIKIAALKAEINDLKKEKEILVFSGSETTCDEGIKYLFDSRI